MLKDVLAKKKLHRISIVSAGVAFYAFIALIPALGAAVAITGLVTDPQVLVDEANAALEAAPAETKAFLVSQIENIASNDGAAGIAAVIGIAASVWSASGAMGHFMEGLNAVYDRQESRSFIVKRGTAVLLMLGALILLAAMVFAMSIVPPLVESFIDSSVVSWVINIGRFVAIGLLFVTGLSVFFRFGPSPDDSRKGELVPGGKASLISVGGAVGTVLMLVISAVFGWTSANLSDFGATYGTLATIIIVLLWLNYMSLSVLLGAEVDAYMRRKAVFDARANAGLDPVRQPSTANVSPA